MDRPAGIYRYSHSRIHHKVALPDASDEVFEIMNRATYFLNPKLAGLPNIKFCSVLEHLICLLQHEHTVCKDEIIFAQIVISHKSRLANAQKRAVTELQRRKCDVAYESPEKLRSQWLQELKNCVDQSCARFRKYRNSRHSNHTSEESSDTSEINNILVQLLQALDEKRSALYRLPCGKILTFCWQYLDDCIKGIYEQTATILKSIDMISNRLACKRRAVDVETNVTEFSFRNLRMNISPFRKQLGRMGGGQANDSSTILDHSTEDNKLIGITDSLQNLTKRVLNGVNQSIQDILSTGNTKSHLIIELRKASCNSDLIRAERYARQFVETSFENVEDLEKKGLVIKRLESIDELNNLISNMENEIETIRQKHSDAVEELLNKRMKLKTLFGELGKMRDQIEGLIIQKNTSITEYGIEHKMILDERKKILGDTSLDSAMRNMLMNELDANILDLESRHKDEIEKIESELNDLRYETLLRQDDLQRQLQDEVNDLEKQLLMATESEKAIILEKLAEARLQLADLLPPFEDEGQSVEEESSSRSVSSEAKVEPDAGLTYDVRDKSQSDSSNTSMSSDWSSIENEGNYRLCQEIDYMKSTITRELVHGLVDCIKKRPADPVTHVSGFIEHRLKVKAMQEEKYKKDLALKEERARIARLMSTSGKPVSTYPQAFGEDGNWDWQMDKL